MAFDDLIGAELQDLVDQTIILIAVENDEGVDSLVDAFDGETKIGNALQSDGPITP